jgi:predicted nucleotide-binding protein
MSKDDEWISARDALAYVRQGMDYDDAVEAICKRACLGLVKAQAAQYVSNGSSAVNAEVPRAFWWAEGKETLTQNWASGDFETWIRNTIRLQAFCVSFSRLDIEKILPAEAIDPKRKANVRPVGRKIFIGHGRSKEWLALQEFLKNRLGLPVEEFNSSATAGVPVVDRLKEMLDDAAFAFLVMTAEDAQSDGKFNPRLNVVHEAGLFQGRLGFTKAIILLEEGCEEFSNIHGLGQIRFPSGDVSAKFEEVRKTLEREGVISKP